MTVEPSPDHAVTHKLQVFTGEATVLWLYDPKGYATILSKAQRPAYRFREADRLKGILIPHQGDEGGTVNRAP
ncbi:hypothetical protein DSLASN_46640 [Desulfoluna limicola]|uniref:Restriction endonuclease domain-containing protein n=1 Tax=Desulfoluna limicola TaxID=2810562 RepID=A0ABM7PNS2_9BACT|nr:hypothetical protein [Desulfoluna limicola]BCS99032.1 hypothetical protein DSLASN_46640 [Desulfoluna limicola]